MLGNALYINSNRLHMLIEYLHIMNALFTVHVHCMNMLPKTYMSFLYKMKQKQVFI